MSNINVIAVSFADSSKAYQAFSDLKEADAQGRVGLRSGAVVARDKDGAVRVPENVDAVAGGPTLGGGLIGMLVGVLGGPIGMLLGWGAGALIGGSVDLDRADRGDELFAGLSSSIPPGSTALVAEVDEAADEVVDKIMSSLGGTVERRPADLVLADLEAAEDAAEAARREVRKSERAEKRADAKEKYEERKAKLQQRLGISK